VYFAIFTYVKKKTRGLKMDLTTLNDKIDNIVNRYPAIHVNVGTNNGRHEVVLSFHNTNNHFALIGTVTLDFFAVVNPMSCCDNVDMSLLCRSTYIVESIEGEWRTAMEEIVKEFE
jgi:hypothetical protein